MAIRVVRSIAVRASDALLKGQWVSQGRFVLINRSNSLMPVTAFISLACRVDANHPRRGTRCALDQAQKSVP